MVAEPSDDDVVLLEKEPIPHGEWNDVVLRGFPKLDSGGSTKTPGWSSGCAAGERRCYMTQDELLACLHRWTQHLSEVHQSQLDEACMRIVRELTGGPLSVSKLLVSSPPKQRQKGAEPSVQQQQSIGSRPLLESTGSRPSNSTSSKKIFGEGSISPFDMSTATSLRNQVRRQLTRISEAEVTMPKKTWWDESVLPNKHRNKFTILSTVSKRSKFEGFVASKSFDIGCGLFIIAFLVTLGMETNHMSQHAGKNSSTHSVASLAFNVWFILELVLRIAGLRMRFFSREDRVINLMDCLLAANSVVDVIMAVLVKDEGITFENQNLGRIMNVLRILRLVRILRLARALRYFYQFRKMVCLIQGCFVTFFWVLLILTSIVFTFAIFFTQGANVYLFQNIPAEGVPDGPAIRQYFGSVVLSMECLFMAIFNGIDWGAVYIPLGSMGWVYSTLFLLFVAGSILGVLNVITSVFVECTLKSALAYRDLIIADNEQSKQVALEHLRDVFRQIDNDGNGFISLAEMITFLGDPNIHTYMAALDINLQDARVLFAMLDADQSGKVDIDEFCDGCLKLKGEAKSLDVHRLICELAKFFKRWSNFTEYSVQRFDSIEFALQASLQTRATDFRPTRFGL